MYSAYIVKKIHWWAREIHWRGACRLRAKSAAGDFFFRVFTGFFRVPYRVEKIHWRSETIHWHAPVDLATIYALVGTGGWSGGRRWWVGGRGGEGR